MSKVILLLLFPILIFYGCASSVYRLNTLENKSDIYMGVETVNKVDDSLDILLQFEGQSVNNYKFYLSIDNKSTHSFIFNPKEIYSISIKYENNLPAKRFYAVDPEKQINDIDEDINKTVQNKKTTDALNGFVSFLSLVSSIATIGKEKTAEESRQEQENSQNFHQYEEQENINYHNEMLSLKRKKEYWQNEIFRTSKYFPGDTIGGIFYIPIIKNAIIIKVIIPVNGKEYKFLYKQTLVK